jgi:hypothetical protein
VPAKWAVGRFMTQPSPPPPWMSVPISAFYRPSRFGRVHFSSQAPTAWQHIRVRPSDIHQSVGPLIRSLLEALYRLQPHRIRTFKRSTDPDFAANLDDVVGPYMNPPRHLIENFFCKLEEFKRIAIRRDKTDQSFAAAVYLSAAVIDTR